MRHQVVHNRGHGFPKDFIPAGVYNFLPTRANRLLMPDHLTSSFGGRQRVDATLYSCAYLSMIHQVRATGDTSPEGPPNSGTYSISTLSPSRTQMITSRAFSQNSSNSHPNGNHQTRGPMDRCAHASSFVRITHTLQRVVCTLSLGSKSRTTGLGSARQN